jgi:hypothetical protein
MRGADGVCRFLFLWGYCAGKQATNQGVKWEGGMLTVKFRQPSHEFTFGVGMTFVSYPLSVF